MKRNTSSSLSAPGAFMLLAGIAAVAFVSTQVLAARSGFSARIAQAAAPALRIQAPVGAPEYWSLASLDKKLLNFSLVNDGSEEILVTGVTLYVSSTPRNANTSSTPALLNFKLRNASSSAQYGSTIWRASPGPTPEYARVSWSGLTIRVPAHGLTPLHVSNDVANVSSALAPSIAGTKHDAILVTANPTLPTSITARGAVSGASASISGGAASGQKSVFAGVVHAGLHPSSPSGLTTPSSQQVIATFSLWHDDRQLRNPSIGGSSELSFDSNVILRSPRTLRVYRDSVAPANLLGSVTLGSGSLGLLRPGITLSSWIIGGTQASPSQLLVTLDTSDAIPGNWVRASLNYLYWTDNIVRNIPGPLELPVAANTLRF